MLNQFLQSPGLDECDCVRQVMCSGEALTAAVQQRFFERMVAKLNNLYGPTEASVDVTYWLCAELAEDRAVPIGRPVANTQIYILDEYLNPVPIGVQGDLYIGGIQLARGYQNRPDLTAATFVPDRFATEPGRRLYKTGDVARFRADGNVEYLGRSDFQVKVRGFRIELGEIESVLQGHPLIKDAVVIARTGPTADSHLVAYVVALEAAAPDVAAMKDYLRQTLPAHMVPAQIVQLTQLPLNKNGKVDRKALPEPGLQGLQLEPRYVEPVTAQEKILVEVWSQVLGIERIGAESNFFNLGGDSIRSLQVITGARARGLRITLQHLFQTPTIRGLAAQSTWQDETTVVAQRSRPFQLIAAGDRSKLSARLTRGNLPS
jgi:acyl-CoA synthetase (AMP-forming)/AMP-acid ligase II/aryl carrier-like protein